VTFANVKKSQDTPPTAALLLLRLLNDLFRRFNHNCLSILGLLDRLSICTNKFDARSSLLRSKVALAKLYATRTDMS